MPSGASRGPPEIRETLAPSSLSASSRLNDAPRDARSDTSTNTRMTRKRAASSRTVATWLPAKLFHAFRNRTRVPRLSLSLDQAHAESPDRLRGLVARCHDLR